MLLFDTETVNTGGNNKIWEFCGVDTKTRKIYHYFHGENIRQALNTKCNNGYLMFFNRYQLEYASRFPWLEKEDFIFSISECLSQYKTLTAYNIGFDAGILTGLGFILDDYNLLDLWGTFVKTVAYKPSYIAWTNKHRFLTKTGLPKTDAETAYKWYSGFLDFKTPHLALKDIKHELVIYEHLQRQKKKKHYGFFGYNDLKKVFC